MPLTYNRIAGQSVERLAALSDGVFAVAMTLLVLDLRVPATEAIRNEHDLWHALLGLSPRLLMYMMSFLTLGIFWVGQQTQQSPGPLGTKPFLDSYRIPVRGFTHAILDYSAGGISRVPDRPGRLLAQHCAAGEYALL